MFNEKGQTLIELIVVMAVAVVIIGALVFVTISSLRNAQFSKNQSQATKLAQEGLERLRSARDRNSSITGIPGDTVNSWNGDDNGVGSIWNYRIYDGCASGINTNFNCYFKFSSPNDGRLVYIGTSDKIPVSGYEQVYTNFKRVVILSDDSASFATQKTVKVVVQWTDFSGQHESQLTTILSKI